MEKFRSWGAVVEYVQPDWVKKHLTLEKNYFNTFIDKDPYSKLVEETKLKVKPLLPRKYKISMD